MSRSMALLLAMTSVILYRA